MKSIGTVMLLLMSAAPASASSAWVLWEYNRNELDDKIVDNVWVPTLAYSSYIDCVSRAEASAANAAIALQLKLLSRPMTIERHGVAVSAVGSSSGKDVKGFLRYECLPDTVDPRGLKAK